MSGQIFLMDANNNLISMTQQQYKTEDLLQSHLANHPDLLASDQIGNEPRRWMLVSREFGVPDAANRPDRWSLDHLFLDQDGIPTLVEVKRSSDTGARREVIAQMLDYAANGLAYWDADKIHLKFRETNDNAEDVLNRVVLGTLNAEIYWQTVKTNMEQGRIRMIFIGDIIPQELRIIIEFLNKQLKYAQIYAIELKQYVSKDGQIKTLVPVVVSKPEEIQQLKTSGELWDEEGFFRAIEQSRGQMDAEIARHIYNWGNTQRFNGQKLRLAFGKGKSLGSFTYVLDHQGSPHYPINIWTNGSVEILFEYMKCAPISGQ